MAHQEMLDKIKNLRDELSQKRVPDSDYGAGQDSILIDVIESLTEIIGED